MNAYRFVILSFLVINIGCSSGSKDTSTSDEWVSLLDKNLSQWDTYIGVPHHTLKNLEGVPKGDGMKGTALGLNNDPLKVFSTIEADGEVNLKVGGEIYGGLTSKKEYENYHLKLEFRWGEKKWEPRLDKLRDNGILYHCIGDHGAFWNVWMQSQEFQIQEGDMGDYYGLAGSVNNIHATMQEDSFYVYDASAELIKLGSGQGNKMYRCVREKNFEKPNGEWNTLELVCLNGKSYHIVNGELVMILDKAESKIENGFSPVTRGKIQLQSEGAEAYYRRIKIMEVQELPDFLK